VLRYFILSLCIYFACVKPVLAQHAYFKIVGLEQGLPSSSVYSIFQDSKGYIWVGTEGGGAAQYSGDKIKLFTSKNGLKGTNIRAIAEDSRGLLLFGSNAGLNIFNGKKFEQFKLEGLTTDIAISSILPLHKNKQIWIATTGAGIYVLEETHAGYQLIDHFYSESNEAENNVFDLELDHYGNVWAAQFGGSIDIYNPTGKIAKINTIQLPEMNLLTIYFNQQNKRVYAGTLKGAFTFEFNNTYSNPAIQSIKELENERVYDIISYGDKEVFATEKKGIFYTTHNERLFFSSRNGLPVNSIYKLICDREGHFWLGTVNGGLVAFEGTPFTFYSKEEGLKNSSVFNIVTGKQAGQYYLATLGSGIQVLSTHNKEFKIDSLKIKLPDNFVTDLAWDKNKNLWFATKNGGAGYWNGDKVQTVTTANGLLSDNVNCILPDSKDRYWFGTTAGLNLLSNGEFVSLNTENGLPNNEVQTLFEDSKGNIWIGTLSGLAKYDDKALTSYDEKEGLDQKTIYAITEDSQGHIWIGTFGGGVYFFDTQEKNVYIRKFLGDDELLSNNVYSLGYNKKNHQLVVGTDKGASVITLDPSHTKINDIKNFVKNNGFLGQETNLNALMIEDQKLFIGTNIGLTILDLSKIKPHTQEIPLHITDLQLFYRSFLSDSSNVAFAIPKQLTLPYNQNHLTFYFEGVSYSSTELIKYSYQLEGQDTAWSPAFESKQITFSSLDPGKYVFKLRVKGQNGKWQNNIQEIAITILPPFYKTWWFITFSIVFSILCIFLFIKWREMSLRKENIQLEKTVAERTREVVIQKNEAEHQKELVEEKQKEILDSISYAKRLQNAIMAPLPTIKAELPESFVIYIPKDIVAGDFYSFEKNNDKILFGAADCTGHGVPGALVSIVCSNAINNVLKDVSMNETGIILDKVRDVVLETFSKSESEVKDGMDISICCIDTKTRAVTWSGANNPLWYFLNNEFHEIKANKQPIGLTDDPQPFTKHELQLAKGDTLYLFTDGYADQFGGPKGKKFKYKQMQEILMNNYHLPLSETEKALREAFYSWKGELEQVDDVCIIGIRL